MSMSSNVIDQDLINLRKLAEQQKHQRALKIKNRNLKQSHDIKLAESLSPITKKLDEITDSTKKLVEVINESNSETNQEIVPVEIDSDNSEGDNIRALPNSSIVTDLMTKTLGRPMSSSNSLKLKTSPSGATFLYIL